MEATRTGHATSHKLQYWHILAEVKPLHKLSDVHPPVLYVVHDDMGCEGIANEAGQLRVHFQVQDGGEESRAKDQGPLLQGRHLILPNIATGKHM